MGTCDQGFAPQLAAVNLQVLHPLITIDDATHGVEAGAYCAERQIYVVGELLLAGVDGLLHAAEGHLNAAVLVPVVDG